MSWKFVKYLLFVIETDVSDESEGDEEVPEKHNSMVQRKENQTSEKNFKKEKDNSNVGKTITEETSETGTVSCRGLWIRIFACDYSFCASKKRKLSLVVL